MNRKLGICLSAILAAIFLLGSTENVSATVGGPIYISQIGYKASANTLYYVESNNGGRGCPPLIHAINLFTLKDTEVKTCEQVETEYFENFSEDSSLKYQQYISDFFKDIPYVYSVNLRKNNINIKIDALSEHMEGEEKWWTDFKATVVQGDEEKSSFNFRGCDKEQPHLVEGYLVPDTDIIVFLVSNKGDCIEGGYIYESLFPVSGIDVPDKARVRSYKDASATEPNNGNLVVYARENISAVPTPAITTAKRADSGSISPLILSAIGLFIFITGCLIGFLIGNKNKNTPLPAEKPV